MFAIDADEADDCETVDGDGAAKTGLNGDEVPPESIPCPGNMRLGELGGPSPCPPPTIWPRGLFIPPKFWLTPKLIWLVRPTRGSIPDELAVGMKPLPLRRGPPTGLVGSPMPTRPRFVGALTGGGRIPSGVVVGGLGLLSNELLFMHMLTMCSFKSLWIGAEFATDWRQSCKLRYNNVLAVLFR